MRRDGLNIEPLTDYIELVISNVFGFYNEDLTPTVQKNLLEQVLKLGYFMNGADIKLFESNCLAGYYELKFRLTAPVFLDWLKEYQFQRMEAFESSNLRAKIEIEKKPIADKTVEMLKELADKVKPQPIFSTDKPTESDRDKFIKQQWDYFKFKFNEVWKGQGMTETTELNQREYVTFGSKMYLKNDYIKLMVEKDLANYDKK